MACILVVDDEQDVLFLVSAVFRAQGYAVTGTSDPTAALGLAVDLLPDLIILDVRMPKLSGYEVLEQLRHHPVTLATPVMMISASTDTADRVRGLRQGATDFLVKPFDPEELLVRGEQILASWGDHEVALRGRLDAYPIHELLQTLESYRKSGTLRLRSGDSTGLVEVESGRVASARVGALSGAEAIWALLEMRDGRFVFSARGAKEGDGGSDHPSLQSLLLEGAWVEDELGLRHASLPNDQALLEWVKEPAALADEHSHLPIGTVRSWLENHAGQSLQAMAASTRLSTARLRLTVALLIEAGAVRAQAAEATAELGGVAGFTHPTDWAAPFAGRPAGNVSIALLHGATAAVAVQQVLASFPRAATRRPDSAVQVFEARFEPWTLRIKTCTLALETVFEVFREVAKADLVYLWLGPGEVDLPIPLRLLQAAAGGEARLMLHLGGDEIPPAIREQLNRNPRWQVETEPVHDVAELLGTLGGLRTAPASQTTSQGSTA